MTQVHNAERVSVTGVRHGFTQQTLSETRRHVSSEVDYLLVGRDARPGSLLPSATTSRHVTRCPAGINL